MKTDLYALPDIQTYAHRLVANRKGFTLIEVIASLVLIGLIAGLGGLGLIQGLQAYFLSMENVTENQRVQLAMNRITVELQRMETIVSGSAGTLTFTSISRPTGERCTIALSNGTVTLQVEPAATGLVLLENVTNTDLFRYLRIDKTAWVPGNDVRNLDQIAVTMTVHREKDLQDSGDQTYVTIITPRNNGLPNGPSPNPKPV